MSSSESAVDNLALQALVSLSGFKQEALDGSDFADLVRAEDFLTVKKALLKCLDGTLPALNLLVYCLAPHFRSIPSGLRAA